MVSSSTRFSAAGDAGFAEILLRQDVGGDLRPELGHLDIVEVEHDGAVRIPDLARSVAKLDIRIRRLAVLGKAPLDPHSLLVPINVWAFCLISFPPRDVTDWQHADVSLCDKPLKATTPGEKFSLPPCGGGLGRGVHRGTSALRLTPTPTPNPSPPQVGPARLANFNAKPGQARVSRGGELLSLNL